VLSCLQAENSQEIARLDKAERDRKTAIQQQIQHLVKQSFIGGFITMGLQTRSIALKRDERVVWESAGFKLKQRTHVRWDSILGD